MLFFEGEGGGEGWRHVSILTLYNFENIGVRVPSPQPAHEEAKEDENACLENSQDDWKPVPTHA